MCTHSQWINFRFFFKYKFLSFMGNKWMLKRVSDGWWMVKFIWENSTALRNTYLQNKGRPKSKSDESKLTIRSYLFVVKHLTAFTMLQMANSRFVHFRKANGNSFICLFISVLSFRSIVISVQIYHLPYIFRKCKLTYICIPQRRYMLSLSRLAFK